MKTINKSKILLTSLAALQLLSLNTELSSYTNKKHTTQEISFSDVAIPMTLAGAAAGLFGAAYLYDDFLYESEKSLITAEKDALRAYKKYHNRYASMIQTMYDAQLLPTINNSIHQKNFRIGVSEHVLYQLANNKKNCSISAYCNRLFSDINHMQTCQKKIVYHINDLEDKKKHGAFSRFETEELRELQYLSRDITHLCLKLETLLGCLELNNDYFVLYEVESRLWQQYAKELQVLYNKNYSYHQVINHLHMIWNQDNITIFKNSMYSSRLQQDKELLAYTLYAIPNCYSDRKGAAQELYHQLDFLYGILLAH